MSGQVVDRIGDGWLSGRPVYIADLDRCRPTEALADLPERHRWRKLPYQAEGFAGTMLLAGPETAAPDISCPLSVRGWHAVSIGIYHEGWLGPSQLRVKLSGEDAFTYLSARAEETGFMADVLLERFWKVADLTGRDLVIGQPGAQTVPGDAPGSFACAQTRIAYVKLVPLTEPEQRVWQEDRARADTRRLFVHNDGHGYIWTWRPTTAEEVRRELQPFRDADVARVYWEAGGGDSTNFRSEIGRPPTLDGLNDFQRRGDRFHAESWRLFRAAEVEPLQVAADCAHGMGLEFHAAYRVAGFHYPPPLDHSNVGSYYSQHPELRGAGRDGRATPRLAYTYPETRSLVVSLLREMTRFPIDGVCLLFNRRPPLVEYEPPLVEGFQREFGRDPREIDERDPEWLAYRARVLTQFMREVRTAMDAVGREQKRAKRIQVSAVVLSTEEANRFNGMDLQAWVQEGLVDTLIPDTSIPNLQGDEAWRELKWLPFFTELVQDTSCVLAPNLMPRWTPPGELRRRAAALYAAGVQYLFAWDSDATGGRPRFDPYWNVFRRLGHREEVAAWAAAGQPALPDTQVKLRVLGDWDLSYATPG